MSYERSLSYERGYKFLWQLQNRTVWDFLSRILQRCYRLIIQQEQIARWDLQNPATLKRFPSIGVYSERHLEEEFPKTKAARLKELEYRLWLLKTHEAQRNEEVTGLDIEHCLRRVAKWCGGKEDAVYGIASMVNHHFDPEARRALLGWLFDIEESMRWDPRRYWHALHPEEVARMVAQIELNPTHNELS